MEDGIGISSSMVDNAASISCTVEWAAVINFSPTILNRFRLDCSPGCLGQIQCFFKFLVFRNLGTLFIFFSHGLYHLPSIVGLEHGNDALIYGLNLGCCALWKVINENLAISGLLWCLWASGMNAW